ncbi:MAG: serine/threonine-protein kinase [Minicystis sp.]
MHAPKAQVAPGDRIDGRYDVEALLGTGGMAVVYRARHAGTGAACALKLVHPHLVTRRELVDLFLKEARAFGRIGKSDHVVEVFDAGFDPARGVPYLAMELLEGETLEEWCERHGPMPPALVGAVFEQLADALDQAHAAGLVHRDVKPSNLFLTTGRRGRPLLKVMDFGIAKVIEAGAARTATQIGTPAYAAPEQMGATMRDVAARQGITVAAGVSVATDVWPLGLVAYELLTGLPSGQFWGAETTVEIPVKAVLYPREAPSARAGDRAGLLPAGFDAWFACTTRTNAAERWPSAGEAAADLVRLLAAAPAVGVPLETPPPPQPPAAAGETEVAWTGAAPPPARGVVPPEPAWVPPEATPARRRPRGRRWIAPLAAGLAVAVAALSAIVLAPRLRVGAARDACRATGARCDEACEAGDSQTCTAIAARAERGDGLPRDLARAAALYRKACDGDDPAGCAGLGRLVRAGSGGLDRDPARAVALFRRACDGGVARGCALLGEAYRDAVGGVARDLVRAVALFQSACDRGDLLSCNDLGGMYQLGRGGLARDDRRAAELYRKACDGGELVGCSDLGVLVGAGRGGYPRDDRLAAELFERACEAGELLGCHNQGTLFGNRSRRGPR